jgi:two-component system, response regulator PdtaR
VAEVHSRRVLIAEDEALIRLDLREMLIEEGYDVVGEAGDGETAVRLAEDLKPDLVILDIKMPIVDGIAAAEKIAGARIAPVVILTAFSQRDLVERARAAGAMAYLVKPFQKSDLVPAIEIAISRFAEVSALESEVASLTDRLETRKAIERAKGMLMTSYGMSEPQAFKWIQRTAMDHRLTMREVAERIIIESPGPPASGNPSGANPATPATPPAPGQASSPGTGQTSRPAPGAGRDGNPGRGADHTNQEPDKRA